MSSKRNKATMPYAMFNASDLAPFWNRGEIPTRSAPLYICPKVVVTMTIKVYDTGGVEAQFLMEDTNLAFADALRATVDARDYLSERIGNAKKCPRHPANEKR